MLNVVTQPVEHTKDWVNHCKELGLNLTHVEIGNEVYFGNYKKKVPSVNYYLENGQEHSNEVKAIFPKAKIGVVISSHSCTEDSL